MWNMAVIGEGVVHDPIWKSNIDQICVVVLSYTSMHKPITAKSGMEENTVVLLLHVKFGHDRRRGSRNHAGGLNLDPSRGRGNFFGRGCDVCCCYYFCSHLLTDHHNKLSFSFIYLSCLTVRFSEAFNNLLADILLSAIYDLNPACLGKV